MLVQQPTDARVTSTRQPQDGLNVTSSVKLRRKNRDSSAEAIKKRNRYSGGDFRIGSPARGKVKFLKKNLPDNNNFYAKF